MVPPERVLDSLCNPPTAGCTNQFIVVPATNCKHPWLLFNFQTIDVEERGPGPHPIAAAREFTIYDEVLCDVEYGQYLSEPGANLWVAPFHPTCRPVVKVRIVGEHGVKQIPVQIVDGRGVTGEEIIHSDSIYQGDTFFVHNGADYCGVKEGLSAGCPDHPYSACKAQGGSR